MGKSVEGIELSNELNEQNYPYLKNGLIQWLGLSFKCAQCGQIIQRKQSFGNYTCSFHPQDKIYANQYPEYSNLPSHYLMYTCCKRFEHDTPCTRCDHRPKSSFSKQTVHIPAFFIEKKWITNIHPDSIVDKHMVYKKEDRPEKTTTTTTTTSTKKRELDLFRSYIVVSRWEVGKKKKKNTERNSSSSSSTNEQGDGDGNDTTDITTDTALLRNTALLQ